MSAEELVVFHRRRLAELAEECGGKTALGKALGFVDGAYIGAMIRGDRPITLKTIQLIEALPHRAGWFTNPPAEQAQAADTPLRQSILLIAKSLPESDQFARRWPKLSRLYEQLFLEEIDFVKFCRELDALLPPPPRPQPTSENVRSQPFGVGLPGTNLGNDERTSLPKQSGDNKEQ